jgi:hypothetical protein
MEPTDLSLRSCLCSSYITDIRKAGLVLGKCQASAGQVPGKRRESLSSSYITEIRKAGLVLGKCRASARQAHLAPILQRFAKRG